MATRKTRDEEAREAADARDEEVRRAAAAQEAGDDPARAAAEQLTEDQRRAGDEARKRADEAREASEKAAQEQREAGERAAQEQREAGERAREQAEQAQGPQVPPAMTPEARQQAFLEQQRTEQHAYAVQHHPLSVYDRSLHEQGQEPERPTADVSVDRGQSLNDQIKQVGPGGAFHSELTPGLAESLGSEGYWGEAAAEALQRGYDHEAKMGQIERAREDELESGNPDEERVSRLDTVADWHHAREQLTSLNNTPTASLNAEGAAHNAAEIERYQEIFDARSVEITEWSRAGVEVEGVNDMELFDAEKVANRVQEREGPEMYDARREAALADQEVSVDQAREAGAPDRIRHSPDAEAEMRAQIEAARSHSRDAEAREQEEIDRVDAEIARGGAGGSALDRADRDAAAWEQQQAKYEPDARDEAEDRKWARETREQLEPVAGIEREAERGKSRERGEAGVDRDDRSGPEREGADRGQETETDRRDTGQERGDDGRESDATALGDKDGLEPDRGDAEREAVAADREEPDREAPEREEEGRGL